MGIQKNAIILFVSLLATGPVMAASNPSSILVKIYGVAVSASLDCSSPISIFDSAAGRETDFLANPVLGGGDIPDGTYPCVMINMSDNIKFIPAQNDGPNCVAGQQYTIDICRFDNSGTTEVRTGTTFGATTACTGTNSVPSPDLVTLYLRTNSNGSNNFNKPLTAGSANGIALLSPFVVAGTSSGRFAVNATGQVSSAGGQCGLNAPAFSFR